MTVAELKKIIDVIPEEDHDYTLIEFVSETIHKNLAATWNLELYSISEDDSGIKNIYLKKMEDQAVPTYIKIAEEDKECIYL